MGFLNQSFRFVNRKYALAKLCTDSKVTLQLSPGGQNSFFDEAIHVKVNGLGPDRSVEVRCKLADSRGVSFEGKGTYCADKCGLIDLNRCPSLGGTYSGVQPMGLFSSLRPLVPHSRFTIRDVSKPLSIDIEVLSDGQVLAHQTVYRRFMAAGVQRVPLEGGNIRGSLFLPPGQFVE